MAEVPRVKLHSDNCHSLLMMRQHWSKKSFGAVRQQPITWASINPVLSRHIASLGHNVQNRIASNSLDSEQLLVNQMKSFNADLARSRSTARVKHTSKPWIAVYIKAVWSAVHPKFWWQFGTTRRTSPQSKLQKYCTVVVPFGNFHWWAFVHDRVNQREVRSSVRACHHP